MDLKTHKEIDTKLNGELKKLKEGFARVELKTTSDMRANRSGLVHGGFIFASGDFAAMAAVNREYVVLAKSECKFLAPVRVGEMVEFEARVIEREGKRFRVEVSGKVTQKEVFFGTFYAVDPGFDILS
jgi:acyl-CoA thioesterase